MVGYWGCEILRIWDAEDVGCWGCGMFGIWNVWDVECSGCGMFGMLDVRDVGCWGCGMFEMWDVGDVGCGMFDGMWDVGLQNALNEQEIKDIVILPFFFVTLQLVLRSARLLGLL